MSRNDDARVARGRRRRKSHDAKHAARFLLPFGTLFAFVMLAPIAYAIYQSFFQQRRSGLGFDAPVTVFVGLANYIATFQNADFLQSIGRVALVGIIQVPIMLGVALGLALLLDSKSARFGAAYRLIYFLPFAMPGVIAAIMWSFLYAPGVSPFEDLLAPLGIHLDFVSPDFVLFSIANMITWAWTGYNMLIIHSALKAIPAELIEAATIDGCSGWRIAWRIKVPLVRPALILTGVFSIIGTIQLYNEPQILGPGSHIAPSVTSTFTPIMVVQHAADLNNYNLAAAMSLVLALTTCVLSFGFLKLTQRRANEV
ncbi:carbohydrate ABC transporter permease [Diaminobutyricibacter sp. McL0608]|uniref:carbohydrate ABC transporter permease n=1 Tax=Leifsonia sp. McL0608 TaxID=3143537 RepID=UPI0031F2E4D3